MSTRIAFWIAPLAFAMSTTLASAQEEVTADTVLATVNGEEITAGHLLLMRASLPQQYQSLPDNAIYEGLLDQAVQQALLSQQVTDMGKAAELALENETRQMRANIEMQDIVEGAATSEALQAAYDEEYANAEPMQEYKASHILLETEDDAAAVRKQIDDGGDFAAVARDESTGPSAPQGGDLGWFSAGMMVPEFESVVMEMEPGEVSEPVQTQFGWHVIKLVEMREKPVPPLSEVEGELTEELQQKAIEARIAELQTGAEVTRKPISDVAPDFLSDPSLLQE